MSESPSGVAPAGAVLCQQLRCGCGNLIARLVNGRVEIKCRRCRRAVFIEVTETKAEGTLASARITE